MHPPACARCDGGSSWRTPVAVQCISSAVGRDEERGSSCRGEGEMGRDGIQRCWGSSSHGALRAPEWRCWSVITVASSVFPPWSFSQPCCGSGQPVSLAVMQHTWGGLRGLGLGLGLDAGALSFAPCGSGSLRLLVVVLLLLAWILIPAGNEQRSALCLCLPLPLPPLSCPLRLRGAGLCSLARRCRCVAGWSALRTASCRPRRQWGSVHCHTHTTQVYLLLFSCLKVNIQPSALRGLKRIFHTHIPLGHKGHTRNPTYDALVYGIHH